MYNASDGLGAVVLTIFIVTYNRPLEFRQALLSVLEAAAPFRSQVRIIVSDDSDDDKTEELMKEILASHGEIVYRHNAVNRGVLWNIYEGFHSSETNYVWCFSDDDMMTPSTLARVLPALEAEPTMVLTNFSAWSADMTECTRKRFLRPGYDKIMRNPEKVLADYHLNIALLSTVIFRRRDFICIPEAVFSNHLESGFAHVAVMYQALKPDGTTLYIADPVVRYRSNNARSHNFEKFMVIGAHDIFNYLAQIGYSRATLRRCRNRYIRQYFFWQVIFDKADGRQYGAYVALARQRYADTWSFWVLDIVICSVPDGLCRMARPAVRGIRRIKMRLAKSLPFATTKVIKRPDQTAAG